MTRAAHRVLVALALLGAAAPSHAHAAPAARPQLTKPPALLEFVEAPYPEGADPNGATVQFKIQIAADGTIKSADIVGPPNPAFDAAAREAVLKFRFSPAEVDGEPSAITIDYRYTFAPRPVIPTTAALAGTIRERGTGEPLANITVTATGPALVTPRTITSDAAGNFRFDDLPPGDVTITLAGERLPAIEAAEQLESGKELVVAYDVTLTDPPPPPAEKDELEIIVVAPPLRREVVATSVRAEEAAKVPGTSGDVVRVVESLPGVARSAAGAGQLIVWGAAPQDTRVYVDGVPIPRLYHEGGLRSVIHPLLVESIDLIPGGYGAQWGRGLGGLVSVATRTPEGKRRLRGRVAADVLDASAVMSVRVGKKVTLAAQVRASYLKLWADQVLDREALAYVPIPRYGDGQLRLLWRPTSTDRVEFVGLASGDRFQRGVPSSDPALAVLDRRTIDFQRIYARWTRDRGDGHVLTVTPYAGTTRARQDSYFGPLATSLAANSILAGLRINRRARVTRWLHFDLGLDAELTFAGLSRSGSLALPPREGDVRVFGQPPPEQIGADRWRTAMIGVAPYAQAEFTLFKDRLRILPGLRIDPYARSVSRRNPPSADAPAVGLYQHDFAVEPRLAIVGQPVWRLQLRAAAGLYRQMPAAEDLSATFGNPRLPTGRALHTVLGAKINFTRTLSLDVTGFFTRTRRLAVRSPDAAPLPAEALEPIGAGRAYGVQALLRQELAKNVFGWLAYTVMRSERRYREGDPMRLSDHDQTHVLTAVLAYQLPRGFDLSGRFRYATGNPRTPVTGAYFDATRNLYQPIFGEQNSVRIPAFVQLDVRLAKQFKIKNSTLDVFLEVLNVWNQKNKEEVVYAPDYQARDYIRSFPVLPAFGLQWDF